MAVSRRHFLTYAGIGTYAALSNPTAASLLAKSGQPKQVPFEPIKPSREDELILPKGYKYNVVCRWKDLLGSKGPQGAETFGFNSDFIAYFPIDALKGGTSSDEGLLWVNHEYPNPIFVSEYTGGRKSRAQIHAEKLCVGGSVIHVVRKNGVWKRVEDSQYTKRITAMYPRMEITGPASKHVPHAVGSLANCSGGRTPWFTALSCEENFQDYNTSSRYGFRWSDAKGEAVDEKHYGWVVEVDPFGELPPVKHSALGRFSHENTAWILGPTNKLVIYMGDDRNNQFLYKFVSAGTYKASDSRADKRKLLSEGTLYAADFRRGTWKAVDIRQPELRAGKFRDQGDVLLRTREAASLLGATPLDRPEDCEVHPKDGSLYVALTNNYLHGNFYGQIVRLVEEKDNPEGDKFRFEIFLAGGPKSGLACPDNLMFDKAGNLWVVCDISSGSANRGCYEPFGNNGMYFVPTSGPSAGDAFQFASGPKDCELTGPCFNENEDTLFLAVQHPGENTRNIKEPTSHWPDGGDSMPRPSIVAIAGFDR